MVFESFIVASKASFESDILCLFFPGVFQGFNVLAAFPPMQRICGYCSVQWMHRFIIFDKKGQNNSPSQEQS